MNPESLNILNNYGTRLILVNLPKKYYKIVQEALNSLGQNLIVDGDIGNITLHAIKKVNNKKLHKIIWNRIYKKYSFTDHAYAWVSIALEELGITEIPGSASNKRIDQYHKAVGLPWAKDDVPWCGSFLGFVMIKAGYKIPKQAARALSWKNFGKHISKPVFGAIAIKKRKGGGHVTIVIGQMRKGKYLVCVGGNQNDKVKVSVYKASVFDEFRVPFDYPENYIDLPTYKNVHQIGQYTKES